MHTSYPRNASWLNKPLTQTPPQFDLLILRLQLGLLRHEKSFTRWSEEVRKIAGALEEKASIPMVRGELELIIGVQTDEFGQDITTPLLENVRKRLRSLVKFGLQTVVLNWDATLAFNK